MIFYIIFNTEFDKSFKVFNTKRFEMLSARMSHFYVFLETIKETEYK